MNKNGNSNAGNNESKPSGWGKDRLIYESNKEHQKVEQKRDRADREKRDGSKF